MTAEERTDAKFKMNLERHEREMENIGDFELVYPIADNDGQILGQFSEQRAPWEVREKEKNGTADEVYYCGTKEQSDLVKYYEELEQVSENVYESFTTGGTFRQKILSLAEYKKMMKQAEIKKAKREAE